MIPREDNTPRSCVNCGALTYWNDHVCVHCSQLQCPDHIPKNQQKKYFLTLKKKEGVV